MSRCLILALAICTLAACGHQPTPTADLVATQIAVEMAAHATMTAMAPTATNTPVPTDTPTPTTTDTDTPTPTQTNTPTSTLTHTPVPTSTPTRTPPPTDTPTPTWTPSPQPSNTPGPKPTKKPKPKPTLRPQTANTLLSTSTELSEDDLYSTDLQGENRRRLTEIGKIGTAKYSPDGERIVFYRIEGGAPHYEREIYVMDADGANLGNITNTQDWTEFEPDWSPDGKKLVFRGRPTVLQYSKVYIMNADGTGRTLLTDVNNSNRFPAWSPDGQKIVFVSYWEGGGGKWSDKGDVFVINVDGSGLMNLTNRGEAFTEPIWSPSGSEVIYSRLTRDRTAREHWQIWRMNADGGNQRCIIGCSGAYFHFSNVAHAWRGSRILFSGWEVGNWDIFIANDDGSGIIRVTDRGFDEKAEDWGP